MAGGRVRALELEIKPDTVDMRSGFEGRRGVSPGRLQSDLRRLGYGFGARADGEGTQNTTHMNFDGGLCHVYLAANLLV